MNRMEYPSVDNIIRITGSELMKVSFSQTYVDLSGFGDSGSEWSLRIGKEFLVKYTGGSGKQTMIIDVCDIDSLVDVRKLLACCGLKITQFSITANGVEMTFANSTSIRVDCSPDELSCSELEIFSIDESGTKKTVDRVVVPDDIRTC
jgi:hypothetical protein